MQAVCGKCGKLYEVAAEGPLGACVACGGELKRVVVPPMAGGAVVTPPIVHEVKTSGSTSEPANGRTLELAEDPLAKGIKCPNCGQWIEAGAEICTACGYSRRLGRTLTTRVGTPEIPRHKAEVAEAKPEVPEIEAEKQYRRAKTRGRGTGADSLRLFVALVWVWLLGAVVLMAPTVWLREHVPLVMPPVLGDPLFDRMNACLVLGLFFVITAPLAALGVRVAAAITNVEINPYLSWLRTAGVIAAVLCTMEVVYTTDQVILHMEPRWLVVALAAEAAVALLVFTWYLMDVRFSGAMVLWFAILFGGALGLLVAAAAYAWVGPRVGVGSVLPPVGQWWKVVGLPG